MSARVALRPADARLLAPHAIRRVQLLGPLDEWADALEAAGIQLADADADLVVATPGEARAAAQRGAPTVLVLGPRRRHLTRSGYLTRTILVRPGGSGPRLFVPLDARFAVRHALLSPVPGRSALKRSAIRFVMAGLRLGLPVGEAVIVGTRGEEPPRIIDAALESELANRSDWYLLTGEGDDLQRLVWFCFDGRPEPEWVVKCSRVAGYTAPFIRDEESLASLDGLPPQLRRNAPRLARRMEVDGLPVAVETAAPGQPLHVLAQEGPQAHMVVIEAIAEWIADLGDATRLPPAALQPELERLRSLHPDLVDELTPLAAVLQHNDLGCWNVLVHGTDFVVVDWESSRRAGMPLWDLVYFLADALTAGDGDGKHQRVRALLCGELAPSALLFERVRSAADRLHVPLESVGRIVTLGWLHHGRSAFERARTGSTETAHTKAPSEAGPLQQVATYWLDDPALGVDWTAFREATPTATSRTSSRTAPDR